MHELTPEQCVGPPAHGETVTDDFFHHGQSIFPSKGATPVNKERPEMVKIVLDMSLDGFMTRPNEGMS